MGRDAQTEPGALLGGGEVVRQHSVARPSARRASHLEQRGQRQSHALAIGVDRIVRAAAAECEPRQPHARTGRARHHACLSIGPDVGGQEQVCPQGAPQLEIVTTGLLATSDLLGQRLIRLRGDDQERP
jgi:hypothetical protein